MSKKKKMPSPDSALKDFFKDNEIFAALFNECLFHNEPVIKPCELEVEDTAYAKTAISSGFAQKINRYRDIIRHSSLGHLVILGIENQSRIHYAMAVRKMLYDALGYSNELSAQCITKDKIGWTIDDSLSGVPKGTKITPIITIIFYTGEDPWDGPLSLHEMMDIDEPIKHFVPDYPLYVIDLGHDKNLSFQNEYLEQLRNSLSSIYSNTMNTNENYIHNSILALTGILTNNQSLYLSAKKKGGSQPMCRVLDERDARIRKEVEESMEHAWVDREEIIRKEEHEKMCRVLDERDARIRKEVEKNMEHTLKERDKTIKELRAIIIANNLSLPSNITN